jgi:hypothetical protein
MISTPWEKEERPLLLVTSVTNFLEILAANESPVDIELPDTIILKAGKIF